MFRKRPTRMMHLSDCRIGSLLKVAVLGGVLLSLPLAARAAPPRIEFDVGYTIECRDVTPAEFAEARPESKIIEARLQISSLLRRGEEKDIKELMLSISSPEQRLRVADFVPKTELKSEVPGFIEVVKIDEDTTASEGAIRGSTSVRFGPIDGQVSPVLGTTKSRRHSLKETYEKLPPKQLFLASGTTNRGHGVFFKLKPSSQASLEGQKEFVCLFVVPENWRGDYTCIACRAKGYNRSLWTTVEECGRADVCVGLYLRGDAEARRAAGRLARAYEASCSRAAEGQPDDLRELLQQIPGILSVHGVRENIERSGEKPKAAARRALQEALDEMARLAGE